jgi:hypothetical protein
MTSTVGLRKKNVGIAYQSKPNILDAHPLKSIFDRLDLIAVQGAQRCEW